MTTKYDRAWDELNDAINRFESLSILDHEDCELIKDAILEVLEDIEVDEEVA